MKKIFFSLLLVTNISFSQLGGIGEDIGYLINDALFFSEKYLSPSEDAFIYQSSSGWMNSLKKRPIWKVTVGLNFNTFIVPKENRKFEINNSDFKFFTLENGTNATVPTAIGNDNQIYMVGQLGTEQVRIKTPEGIDQELVFYPHLFGALSVGYGTELLVKLAPKTKLKKSDYQVYGAGIKHNLDQYFKSFQKNKINLSSILSFSKETISFDFIETQSSYGSLGINRLTGDVGIWQTQISGSKEYKNYEFILGIIANSSHVKYRFTGPKGQIEETISVQSNLNEKLKELYKTRTNFIGELSCRYKLDKLFFQTSLGLGKFVNTNLALQYEF